MKQAANLKNSPSAAAAGHHRQHQVRRTSYPISPDACNMGSGPNLGLFSDIMSRTKHLDVMSPV